MNILGWILLATVCGVATVVTMRVWGAWGRIRLWIQRLAEGDYRIVIIDPPFGFFKPTIVHLRQISENLRRQSRQITEEGFSLKAILESMEEGVMIVDSSMRIRLANPALIKAFGFSAPPVDRAMVEVFRIPELRDAVRQTLDTGNQQQLTIQPGETTFAPGISRTFDIYAAPLRSENQRVIRGAVVVFSDVTRLREIEITRREFVANVSHEFRTPLAIISGYLETLQEDGFGDEALAKEALQIMSRHCDRLNRLIDDLLVISRLELQQLDLQAKPVRLDSLIQRLVEQLSPPDADPEPQFFFSFAEDAIEIEGDPWRIEQVISNLIANALRYGAMEGEPPRIHLSLARMENFVEFRCRDEGPGIPHADQPHIFERFYRVHKDRSRDAGGTGLGLSIVKNIVLAHGGSVALESTPGKGATFIVRLPRLRPRLPYNLTRSNKPE